MRRVIFTLFVVGLAAVSTSAQTSDRPSSQSNCALTLSQSPAIRGMKLGLSTEQVLSMFPGSNQRPEIIRSLNDARGYPNYGLAGLSFTRVSDPLVFADKFSGIGSFWITVFDGRVNEIRVWYAGAHETPEGADWPGARGLDEFITKISEAFALPPAAAWVLNRELGKVLTCQGFDVIASNSGERAALRLRVTPYNAYNDALEVRRATDEQNLRKAFKP